MALQTFGAATPVAIDAPATYSQYIQFKVENEPSHCDTELVVV